MHNYHQQYLEFIDMPVIVEFIHIQMDFYGSILTKQE